MKLEYLDGVFEEIDSEESREISGGEVSMAIVVGGITVVGMVAIGAESLYAANKAHEEQTEGGTLADIQKGKGGGVKGGRN